MSETVNDNNIEINLPLIPLRGIVGFPAVQLSIEIARPSSLKAFTAAATMHEAKIILAAQKDIAVEEPEEKDLYKTGILAEIKHVVKNPQGTLSVIFEGLSRVKLESVSTVSGHLMAYATLKKEPRVKILNSALEALMHEVKTTFPV